MVYRDSISKWLVSLVMVGLLLLLSGCGNDYAERVQKDYSLTEQQLNTLGKKLDTGQLINTQIIGTYSKKLATLKPDFKSVADAMAKDATRQGTLYQGLSERLKKINRKPDNKQQFQAAYQSLVSIKMGSDPIVFNDALIDLINTLAQLSGGKLDTVSIPKDSKAAHVRGETIVPGSYLVGNPSYGQYKPDSSGRSIWQWYGQYAFFSSLFKGNSYNQNPISYSQWNSRSHYSYYRDYGRRTYGSRNDQNKTATRTAKMRDKGLKPAKPKKQYGSAQGRKRISTYSKQKSKLSQAGKKYGSTNAGGRHADKAVSKRSSSLFSSKKSSGSSSSSSSTSKRSSPSKRSFSLFSSSSRSSSRSSSGSSRSGGK
ncbi:MAG: hypothetical protein Q9M50_11685 [Methylococcales bacterium]|nr:hypothetical protein [Methylococcales bacterium]